MADPLSLAAGSFAVVGVVDVVLRAGIECCRFLSDIKDAPAEIDRLKMCIKENTQLVETLKKDLDHLQDPSSSMVLPAVDLSSAYDGFNSSVRALHRELNALQTLAKKHGGADTTWARVKWVLDGRKISKSLEKLERSKSTLSVTISLIKGLRQSACTQKRIENSMQQSFQQITSTMDSQLQELSIVRTNQERAILHSTQQLKKSNVLRKDLLKASRMNQKENNTTQRMIADGNQNVINVISSKLEGLCIAIPKAPTVATSSNRDICFIGGDRESILPTLLLIKDYIRWAVLHLLSHHAEQASSQHLYSLQSEFDHFISSAIQEAAGFSQRSTATSFDQWIYSTKSDSRYNTAVPLAASIPRNDCEVNNRARAEPYNPGHQRQFCSDYKSFSFSFPVGKLCLTVPRTSEAANVACSINKAYFSFVPSIGISAHATRARFCKFLNPGLEPKLYTQLNAFRIVEDEYPHIDLFSNGSIEDIDAAFRNGTITPYDQFEGVILCPELAARFARREVLEYLDNQGVGFLALNGELDALSGFWSMIQNVSSEKTTIDSLLETQAYFEDRLRAGITTSDSSLLYPQSSSFESLPEEYSQPIKTWMDFLKRNDYNFNVRDDEGNTPLHNHIGRTGGQSLANVRLLLEFGANPRLVDSRGRNAIHIAMESSYLVKRKEPEILEEKISLLIERGAKLRHCDKYSSPLSIYAIIFECWPVWCRALERNGIKIDEVLEECKESLSVESSDEESTCEEYVDEVLEEGRESLSGESSDEESTCEEYIDERKS